MSDRGGDERLLSPEHRSLTISLIAAIALIAYANLSVSAALPAIGDDLGNVALVPWVITVELLASAIAVLAVGPVVDERGVRVVFRASMLLFVVFSVFCGVAPSMATLIAARVGQGVAAGGVLGSAVSSIGLTYSEAVRPRAYATISAVWGAVGLGGPAIAAVLIAGFGWRAIFTVTVPVAIIATAIGWNQLPGRRADVADVAFDRSGLVVVSAVTVGLLMATSSSSLIGLLWFAAAVVAGLLYIRHSRRLAAPVVRPDHLIARRWRYLHIAATLAITGGTGGSAYLPLYVRGARGLSESQSAFSVVFLVVGWSVGAFIASKLQERMHAARVVLGGAVLLTAAMSGATVAVALDTTLALLFAALFLVGLGIGSITTSSLAILQGRAGTDEMGRVSSAHQFLRSLGFAYGAAIGGAVLFFVVSRQIGDVEAIRDLLGADAGAELDIAAVEALKDGFAWALGVTAVLSTLAVVASTRLVQSIGKFVPAKPVVDQVPKP